MARGLVRARGRLWTAGRDIAVDYAHRSPERLVGSLRDLAGSRTKPVFVRDGNILLDLVVHGQDIAVPLGLDRTVPIAAGRLALQRVWSMGWPFHARRRLAGVHLQCEDPLSADVVWEAGDGPLVAGSAAALALLMTGRTAAALPMLRGAGVARLGGRVKTSKAS